MRWNVQLLTKNECYKAGTVIIPKGIMLHSTGVNNPTVRRYVPGDNDTGYNQYGNHWDTPKPDGQEKCVHGFIGKFADGKVGFVQTLPWNRKAWHCGGSANGTHIGVEICEDSLQDAAYLKETYKTAVELFVYLCDTYCIDPMKDGAIICHSEGAKRGVASSHSDVMHWWSKHGVSMDDFRQDIEKELTQMQEARVREIFHEELKKMATEPQSDWAESIMKKAIQNGITDGSRPRSFATREEVVAMCNKVLEASKNV